MSISIVELLIVPIAVGLVAVIWLSVACLYWSLKGERLKYAREVKLWTLDKE